MIGRATAVAVVAVSVSVPAYRTRWSARVHSCRWSSIHPPYLAVLLSPFPCSPAPPPPTILPPLSLSLRVSVCALKSGCPEQNRSSGRHGGRASSQQPATPLADASNSAANTHTNTRLTTLTRNTTPSDMSASRAVSSSASSSSSGSAASSHFEKMRAVDRLAPANVKHNHDVVFFTSVADADTGQRKGEEGG